MSVLVEERVPSVQRRERSPARAGARAAPIAEIEELEALVAGAERDPGFIRRHQRLLERFASYYRPEVRGFEHLPASGPFLVVGNHSGGATPPDLPILMTAWWRERGVEEPVYGLFHSTMARMPGMGSACKKAGGVEASPENASRLLRAGAVVVVYPGGDHEALRPWTDRNRIDFAGRTGFVRLALEAGVPVVPAVTHGAHDSVMVLSRGERLAKFMPHLRLMRVKACPVILGAPWGISFGLPTIPLPTTTTVQLGSPIQLAGDPNEASVLRAGYDRVTSTMQRTLDELAAERA